MQTSRAAPTGGLRGGNAGLGTVLWVSTCHIGYLGDILCVHSVRPAGKSFPWHSVPAHGPSERVQGKASVRLDPGPSHRADSAATGFSALIHTAYCLYRALHRMIVCIYDLIFAVNFVLRITYKLRLFLFLFCLQFWESTCCLRCGFRGEERAAGSYRALSPVHVPHSRAHRRALIRCGCCLCSNAGMHAERFCQ